VADAQPDSATTTPTVVGVAAPRGACDPDAAVSRHATPFETRVERAIQAEARFREGLRVAHNGGLGGRGGV
jgi:hypothetical protein